METIPFTDGIEAVRSYLYSRGKSDNTITAYVSDLRMFALDMKLSEFPKDPDSLERLAADWLNSRRRIIAPRSTRRRLTSCRTLAAAYGMEILKRYAAPSVPPAEPHPLPDGKYDLAKLLREARNEQQRVLVALLGMCGLRVSEARNLGPWDVDLRERKIKVFGKGSRTRTVEISQAAYDVIFPHVVEAQLDNRPRLIEIADRSARHAITMMASRAGITRPVASHDLRATFATEAYHHSGNDVRVVQDLLGHANVTTTQGYIDPNKETRRSAVEFMTGILL